MVVKNSEKNRNKNNNVRFAAPLDEEQESWLNNGLHRFIIVFSVVWFGIVAVYLYFFGWENLFSMVPNEFCAFMTTITLPLAIIWVIMAYIDRGSSFKKETRMLRDSLNQVIFPDSKGNEATKMIAEAIKSQVAELKETTRDVCAQSDVIKRDLTERVTELKELTAALDKYSSQSMQELNAEIQKMIENFTYVTEKASATTADFRVNTLQMREDSEKITATLTPIVNEMVTAAEHVKEVVNVNNENISKAQERLSAYADSSQIAIGKMIEAWAERGENLQKTFLRTSENCEEMFRRLDSGISHIESSIQEQKQVVETQSGLIDKNSAYLDNKLGEYGKLISLEVEAMVKRSGSLEENIQKHLRTIREVSTQVSESFGRLGEDIVNKRKQLEAESLQSIENINATITRLGEEIKHLQDFYGNAQNKNSEFTKIFNNVSQNLHEIENGMNKNLHNFSENTSGILSKFDEVNRLFSGNVGKLIENADVISKQSKENADLLTQQDEYINKTMSGLKEISGNMSALNKEFGKSSKDFSTTLSSYEGKMNGFNQLVTENLKTLQDGYDRIEKQFDKYNAKFKSVSMDTFMRSSSDIINEMESLSIDINAIFNKADKDDELWKKYYAGDHGVFTRYLAKNMTKKQVISIREDYENKGDFRLLVDKYLEDFNVLVANARENERASTLLALISGSDIGKVYYILAKALDKLN